LFNNFFVGRWIIVNTKANRTHVTNPLNNFMYNIANPPLLSSILEFYWPWFIKVGLGRTTIGSHSIISCQIPAWKSQVKRHGKVFSQICVFLKYFFPTLDHKQIFNTFSTNLHLISFNFNSHSNQCIWIQFDNSMYLYSFIS
jgi:hypothetical protein